MPYTEIEEDIVVCNDCGAHASSEAMVKHYSKCTPRESEYWKKYYEEAWEEEEYERRY